MATAQAPESNYFARKANRFLAALIFRDFRFLAVATLCSGSGAWALIVARASWVYEIPAVQDANTAGLWVGLVTFAAMSPRFFATPFIGYLADKVTRKRLLQWVYVLQLAQASVMAVLVMMGVDNPWYVVILAIVNGTLRATQQTAAQSLAPNLVDRERLPNAVALNEAMQQGSRAVGPAILLAIAVAVGASSEPGSPLFSLQSLGFTIGTSAIVFWSCAAFYLVALISSLNIRTVSTGNIDRRRSFWANTAAGFAYAYSTPLVFGIILMAVAHCVLVMSFESMLPPLAREKLSPDGLTFSRNDVYALMTALGIGALFSSIFVGGIVSHLTRGRIFLLLGFTSSLTPIGLGLSFTTGISITAAILMGLGTAGFMTITHTIIQSVVPDDIRGRVASVYSMHVGGSMAFANLLYGRLADYWSAGNVMAIAGAAFTIVVIVTVIASGFWRGIYFRGQARPVAAAAPAGGDDD